MIAFWESMRLGGLAVVSLHAQYDCANKTDGTAQNAKIDKLFIAPRLAKEEVDEAVAGDIVYVVGAAAAHIGETLADRDNPEALPVMDVEAPTISMYPWAKY